ncbi:MAG: DUF3082 domain-containing protein [Cyanobacteria bacterium P01_A01_bin.84]
MTETETKQQETQSTPIKCFTGSLVSGGMTYAAYSLTMSIATSFANKPVHSEKLMVIRISSLVRTLVVGVFTLGTVVFGLVALGLLALGIQLLFQQVTKKES